MRLLARNRSPIHGSGAMAEKQQLPLYMSGRDSRGKSSSILRYRWGPCALAITVALLLATFCFDLLGRVQRSIIGLQPVHEAHSHNNGAAWDGWGSLDKIFVFGETYSSNGFDQDGRQPGPGNPFGNPELREGSGVPKLGPMGPLWVHYVTTMYNESFVKTYDLAKGGSTIDRDLVNPVFPTANTFGDQIEKTFMPRYAPGAPESDWAASKTLFAIFFGGMDMIIKFHASQRPPVDKIIESYGSYMEKLHELGARNFLLFTIPPLDRAYAPTKVGVRDLHNDIADFNARLKTMHEAYAYNHPDVNVYLFDVHALFSDIITNPTQFEQTKGLTYTKGPCPLYDLGIGFEGIPDFDRTNPKCGVPISQYFWHDYIHTTYPTQNAIAAIMVQDCMGTSRKRYCL